MKGYLQEKTAKLFYLKYKLESSEEFILVATTNPKQFLEILL